MKQVQASLLILAVLHFSAFSQCADSTLYAPSAFILSGFIANDHTRESIKNEIAKERKEHIPRFKTKLDNYFQFSPLAIAYGLDAIGIRSKTDILNRSVILLKGEILPFRPLPFEKSISYPAA